MKGQVVSVKAFGALVCTLLVVCVGIMGQGCPLGDGGGTPTPTPPPTPPTPTVGNSAVTGKYIGASKDIYVIDAATNNYGLGCGFCHGTLHTDWSATNHAKALTDLEALGQGSNAACLVCHTTGFGQTGGFVDRATTDVLGSVVCEACHGTGADHIADVTVVAKQPPKGVAMLGANICGDCHKGHAQADHFPTFEEFSESKHAGLTPKADAIAAGTTSTVATFWEEDAAGFVEDSTRLANCGICHSGDYRQLFLHIPNGATAPENVAPAYRPTGTPAPHPSLLDYGFTITTPADATHPIPVTNPPLHAQVCVVCHQPHKLDTAMGSNAQLRYPLVAKPTPSNTIADATNPARFNVCGQCHHLRGADGTDAQADTWKKTSRGPHHAGQVNMGNGEMPLPAVTTSAGSTATHVLGTDVVGGPHYHFSLTTRQCSTCHMAKVTDAADPTQNDSGHKFELNTEACKECHAGLDGKALKDAKQAKVQAELDKIKARLDNASAKGGIYAGKPATWWAYGTSGNLTGLSATQKDYLYQLRYAYSFIDYDGSKGIHNPDYTDSLISAIKTMLGTLGL